LYLAKKLLKRHNARSMMEFYGRDMQVIKGCAKEQCLLLEKASNSLDFKAVFKKYSSQKFNSVA